MELHSPLHLSVVAIEKGALSHPQLRSPTFIYMTYEYRHIKQICQHRYTHMFVPTHTTRYIGIDRTQRYVSTSTHTYCWLVGFYGISTIVGYLMPNPLYTYILNIYILFVNTFCCETRLGHFFYIQLKWFQVFLCNANDSI